MEYKTENQIPYNIYDKINIYLTGYGPFLTIKENPSEKIVTHIFNNSPKLNTEFTNIIFNQIFEVKTENVDNNISNLFNIIKKHDNNNNNKDILHIIISLGVAENRKVNTLEIRAKNHIYDRIIDKKIDENKPDFYYSKTPIKYIIKGIQNFKNSECKFSNDAGTYLCNYMYFTTLTKCFDEKNFCSFFLHVPLLSIYSMEKQEIFFKNFIEILESLYIKGNEEKRNKILEFNIEEEDEHIDEWNKKKIVKDKQGNGENKKEDKKE
jgi:pyroglutamyl-peptidase